MKKKFIITCSLITILLAGFPNDLYAEDVPQNFEGGYTTHYGNISELDDYFYQNFVLLPYLQSDGIQYIDTGYNVKDNLKIDVYLSNILSQEGSFYLYGENSLSRTHLGVSKSTSSDINYLWFDNNGSVWNMPIESYNIIHIESDNNVYSINDEVVHSFNESSFNGNSLYIFARNNNNSANLNSSYNLYYFSIYDYDADSGNGALVRSFYPARLKSNGSYGLYDAVNKIFYVSNSGTSFENPEGSDVELSLLSRIGLWLRTSIESISEIFEYIVTEPIILFFIAIGLAGAAFRWTRRIVHF